MNKKMIRFSMAVIVIFALFYIWYCNAIMVEAPSLSWFRQIRMADQFFSGDLGITDLFSSFGEHGMLACNVIYLLNVSLFHGMTKFDVILNDINVIITGSIIVYGIICTIGGEWEKRICIMIASLFMFTCMQGSSGAMETQVRLGLLFFIIACSAVDKELHMQQYHKNKHLIKTLLLMFLSINVFGTMYSFAAIPLVWAIIFYNSWKNRQLLKNQVMVAAGYFIFIIIYIFEYKILVDSHRNESIFDVAIQLFTHPVETLKCICSWCANGILGWGYHESATYNGKTWLVVGGIVFLMVLFSVALFFITKMYLETWIPLLFITYCFGVMVMVFLGRNSGWEWFANEWYNVHLKLLYAGTVWIYIYVWDQKKGRSRFLCLACSGFFCVCSIVGTKYCLQRAPYVHAYYENMQKYLFVDDPQDMPVDEDGNTPLIASLDTTMEGIRILREHNLSVYRYWDAYEACPSTAPVGDSIKYVSGRYDDGWAEKECSFSMKRKDAEKIKVSCYALHTQELTIVVNGKKLEDSVVLQEGESEFFIPCLSSDEVVNIKIKSDYSEQLAPPDTRRCSYMIVSIERQ